MDLLGMGLFGIDLLRVNFRLINRGDPEKAFSKMSQIPIWIPVWRHAFVDLHYMDALPCQVFLGQRAQHNPWAMTAADGHHELAARSDGGIRFGNDKLGGCSGGRSASGKSSIFILLSRLGCESLRSKVRNYAVTRGATRRFELSVNSCSHSKAGEDNMFSVLRQRQFPSA